MEMIKGLGVKLRLLLTAVALSCAFVLPAMADTTFDITPVTTMLTAVGVGVAGIGAAVLIVKFGAKAWKWLFAAG